MQLITFWKKDIFSGIVALIAGDFVEFIMIDF